MTEGELVRWSILYLRGQTLPEGPQAADALVNLLTDALDAIPCYVTGSDDDEGPTDDIIARIEAAMGIEDEP